MVRYILVPLTRYTQRREEIHIQLKNLDADRIFLCTNRRLGSDEQMRAQLACKRDGI